MFGMFGVLDVVMMTDCIMYASCFPVFIIMLLILNCNMRMSLALH